MSKEQIVSDAKSALVVAQDAALQSTLESVYDQAATEQKASDGTLTQGDVDSAVAAAVAPLNQQIADLTAKDAADMQSAVDAKAAGDQAVAAVQAQLDALSAKELVEAGVIDGLKGSVGILQDVVAKLSALTAPAPTPEDPATQV